MDDFNSLDPGHLRFLENSGGRVVKTRIDDYVDITFDDMAKAASWVSVYDYQDRCEIVGTVNFTAPVTVRVNFH